MSEYERMRQEARREQARERRIRFLVRGALLLAAVAAAYAVAGYFAYVHLPEEIARLEKIVSADNRNRQDAVERAGRFQSLRRKFGLDAAGKDVGKQFAALVQLARQPGFGDLQKDGGLSAIAELPRLQARLEALRKDLAQKQVRVKMLDREFEGPMGKGSASWKEKRQKAEDARADAETALREAMSARDEQVRAAMEKLAAYGKSLDAPRGTSPEEERLGRLRAWRDRLQVWPLPVLARKLMSKES